MRLTTYVKRSYIVKGKAFGFMPSAFKRDRLFQCVSLAHSMPTDRDITVFL